MAILMLKRSFMLTAIAALALAALSLEQALSFDSAPTPASRTHLSYQQLQEGVNREPVPMAAFTPIANGLATRQQADHFEGRLTLSATANNSHSEIIKDTFQLHSKQREQLPPFDFEFLRDGEHLIPIQRGIISNDHYTWEYILEPGKVWREDADRGFSRATLPFTLVEKNENCMHNGVVSFLYKDDGHISHAAYQISAETCLYYQTNMWGSLEASYAPTKLANAEDITASYRQEVVKRLPMRPIEELMPLSAQVNIETFSGRKYIDPSFMSSFGFFYDGIHYVSQCQTRHGPYPFCDTMTLPSYSTAKTNFAGVAMMALQKMNPEVFQQKIANYVPECRDSGLWDDVTFENALDMATGNFENSAYLADESAPHTSNLFEPKDHASKVDYACNYYPRNSNPNQEWVYHTSDTYLLGTALEAYSKQHLQKGVFEGVILESIWQPLYISPSSQTTRRTVDVRQQPFTGWGLAHHRDDIVKLGRFLQSGGRVKGQAILDERELKAALQLNPDDRGLTPDTSKSSRDRANNERYRYNNGLWAFNLSPDIDCEEAWVPFMSGYGGIIVALFPNDSLYYYFSDSGIHRWKDAAIAAHNISSFCPNKTLTRP